MTLGESLSSAVFLQSIGIVGLLFTKKKAAPAEAAPVTVKTPADECREKLRSEHGVRLVDPEAQGTDVVHVAPGSFGWTYAPLNDAPLFRQRSFQAFEMHKPADGHLYLIGFVTKADRAALDSGAEVKLFPDATGEATDVVSVRVDRVDSRHRQPNRDGGGWLAMALRRS